MPSVGCRLHAPGPDSDCSILKSSQVAALLPAPRGHFSFCHCLRFLLPPEGVNVSSHTLQGALGAPHPSVQGRAGPQCSMAWFQQGTRREQWLRPTGAERAPAPLHAAPLRDSAQSEVSSALIQDTAQLRNSMDSELAEGRREAQPPALPCSHLLPSVPLSPSRQI